VLHRQLDILPSNHLTVGVSGGIMSRPCKRHGCCNPAKYLIVNMDSDETYQATSVQLREVLKVCQG